MREDWKYLPLGEICDLLNGFAFKSSLYVNDGIRVIRIANVQKGYIEDSAPAFYPISYENELSRYMLQEGDLLMSLTGNVGRVGILHKEMLPAALNQRVACIRLRTKDILLKYLFHYFNSNFFEAQCIASSHGAAQLNMSTVWLAKHLVPVPPLPEQERIVALLDTQFAKIDALKTNTASQLQAAKDLFQSALKELLTPKEGWKYQKLGELTTSINGLWKGKKEPFVNVGVIRNANFTKNFTLNYSNIEYLDVEQKQYRTRKLQKGDLIVEKSGGSEKQPVGRTVLFDADGEFSVSNFTSILRINDRMILAPKFLYIYLLYIYGEGVTRSMQKATTGIHNIEYDKFLSIPIPVLSIHEQKNIVEQFDALSERVKQLQSNYEQTITLCNDLKQSLLKSIFE